MSKYVSVEKLDNGDIKIVINKIPESDQFFKISFDDMRGNVRYISSIVSESKMLASTYYFGDEEGCGVIIRFDKKADINVNPQYCVVLENSPWINSYFEDIKKQLLEQAEQIEFNIAVKQQVKQIEKDIKTKNYSTLIQNMIKQYADELTDTEVMDIQRTLTDVKEERGLTPRQTYRFGL